MPPALLGAPVADAICDRVGRMTLAAFGEGATVRLPVGEEFARRRGTRLPVELAFERHAIPGVGELRYTTLRSNRVDIIALMIFPNCTEALPVYASEFVIMGGRCRVAVADHQTLARDSARRAMHREAMENIDPIWRRWNATELPKWCAEHFSPHAMAALGVDVEAGEELLEGYADYLAAYRSLASESKPTAPRPSAALDAYKQHHIAHTPGRPFMSATFGAEWTEDFFRNAMYR